MKFLIWSAVGLSGVGTLWLFAWFLKTRTKDLSAPLLGLFTIGVTLLVLAIVRPESVKFQGMELVQRVEKIEKNLRPFAVVEIGSTVENSGRGILYQTFKEGEFDWPAQNGGEQSYRFSLAKKPKFVEVRCDKAQTDIKSEKESSRGVEYTMGFSSMVIGGNLRCIVEAFFE